MRKVTSGYIYGVGSALVFSVVSILGKVVMTRGFDPGILIFWQYVAVLIALGTYFYFAKISLAIKTPYALIVGLFSIAANLSFYFAMNFAGAGLATLLLYSSSVFTALFFFLSGIRRIPPSGWLAIFLALLGSALTLELFTGFTIHPIGVFLGLFAGLVYGFYGIVLDLKLPNENFLVINFYIALQGLFVISLFNFTREVEPWNILSREVLVLLLLGLMAGILPNYLSFSSIRLIGAEKTSVVMSMELPSTVLLAFFFLEEKMGLLQGLGILLVLASVLLLRSQEEPAKEF